MEKPPLSDKKRIIEISHDGEELCTNYIKIQVELSKLICVLSRLKTCKH